MLDKQFKPKRFGNKFRSLTLVGLASFVLIACTTASGTPSATLTPASITETTPKFLPTASTSPLPTTVEPAATPTLRIVSSATETPASIIESEIKWRVPTVEIPIRFGCYFDPFAIWTDAEIIKGKDADCQSVSVDTSSANLSTLMPTAVDAQPTRDYLKTSFSPKQTYVLRCSNTDYRLYRATGEEFIQELDARLGSDGCLAAQWSLDESKLAVVTGDGGLYVWYTDGSSPNLISQVAVYTYPSWSPDGERLAVTECDLTSEKAYATVFSAKGPRVSHFEISGCGVTWGGFLEWLSATIIIDPLSYGSWTTAYEYYDVSTGHFLGSYLDDSETPFAQTPNFSPDEHWGVFDESSNSSGTWEYVLHNLQNGEAFTLSNSSSTFIKFVGWSPDSSRFYLVSRPTDETAIAYDGVPFGLLMLDPNTRQLTQFFPQAMDAEFNQDQQALWVVFPAKQINGGLGLDGGLLDLSTDTMLWREPVSDSVTYGRPVEGDLIPAAWSEDGRRLVFGDSQGNLKLATLSGTPQLLATGLPQEAWPKSTHYAWSPDNKRLLVQYGERVWVVDVIY